MSAYCAASSSWRSAKPTVRNSAKISKPSNSQPRFEAISTPHCSRLSERYQGSDAMAVLLFIPRFSPVRGNAPSVQAAKPDRYTQKYTLALPAGNTRVRRRGCRLSSGFYYDVDPAFGDGRIVRAGLSDGLLLDQCAGNTVRFQLIGDDRAARLREILVGLGSPGGARPGLDDNSASAGFARPLCCIGDDGLGFV